MLLGVSIVVHLATVAGAVFIGYRAGKWHGTEVGHRQGYREGVLDGEWFTAIKETA